MNQNRTVAILAPLALIVAAGTSVAQPSFASSGTVQFYSSTGADPTGDLGFRADLQDVLIGELDFEGYSNGALIPSITVGGLTIAVNLLNDDGTVSSEEASAFSSPNFFTFPGAVDQQALLNGIAGGMPRARMEFVFSTPVRGFGFWVFDDEGDANHQYVMHVTLAGGQGFTSPILDEGSIDWVVDGFLGAVATTGIASVIVECQDPNGSLSMDYFELDHMQVAPVATNYCSVAPNSTGGEAVMSARGSANLTDNDLTLTATPVPDQPFLFFYGPDQQEVPFGNGFLCVTGGITRINPPNIAAGNLAQRAVDLPTAGIAMAGTLRFQCWYRDPAAGGASFNLSDGLSVPFLP